MAHNTTLNRQKLHTMESLTQLKKELIANGRLSREEVLKLREAMFDNEGLQWC